jgi:hypothetical protein
MVNLIISLAAELAVEEALFDNLAVSCWPLASSHADPREFQKLSHLRVRCKAVDAGMTKGKSFGILIELRQSPPWSRDPPWDDLGWLGLSALES